MKSRTATEADENDLTELRLNGDDAKRILAEAWAVEVTIVAIAMVKSGTVRLWRGYGGASSVLQQQRRLA